MRRRATREEYADALKLMATVHMAAQKEIVRRGEQCAFVYEIEEWLLFAAQHGDLVGEEVRKEAEELIVGKYAVRVWNALSRLVEWDEMPELQQEADPRMCERIRTGCDSLWEFIGPAARRIAREIVEDHRRTEGSPLA